MARTTDNRRSRPNQAAAPADALLLSRPQVARRLGVSVVTVDRLVKAGDLRPVDLLGLRRVLFSAQDVDRLVEGLPMREGDAP